MTAAAVRMTGLIPAPRTAADDADRLPARHEPSACRAVAYQRVLHQLVRRELRLLAELSAWAPADEEERITALTRHAELIGRVLLHHHTVERESVWPALLRAVPAARPEVEDWTRRCARIDHMLRDVATAARQWAVTRTCAARDAFALTCLDLADAVDAQTAAEEAALAALVAEHLPADSWTAITHSGRCQLPAREQLLVLGLALEDCCAGDRARLLEGLPRSVRLAWRLVGRRQYRAAVVRLRGAPPAP